MSYLSVLSPLLVEEQGGIIVVSDVLPKIRLEFLSKIYGLITVQVLIATCMCTLFTHYGPITSFVNTFYPIVIGTSSIATFVSLIHLLQRFLVSVNDALIYMFTFTFCQSVLFGSVCVTYAESGLGTLAIESLVTSLVVLTGITMYTSVSHWDFSFAAGGAYTLLVFAGMCSLINFGMKRTGKPSAEASFAFILFTSTLFCLFVLYNSKFFAPASAISISLSLHSYITHSNASRSSCCICTNHASLSAALFCSLAPLCHIAYLLIDELGPDDVVPAAVTLYTDHLSLCLQLLIALAGNPDREPLLPVFTSPPR